VRRPRSAERLRDALIQAVVLAGALALAAWFVGNTLDNLSERGIASGFGFLDSTAGFSIIFTLIDYSELSTYGRAFLVGLLNTLLVSAVGVVAATILGVLVGVARLSTNWLVARLATVYVETFRNVPLLLQIFFWYFAVLSAMPPPRQSHALLDAIFLNNRGLYLPKPLLTPDQVEMLKHDNVVSEEAKREDRTLEAFGIDPTAIATVVPSYLWRFRKTGQFRNRPA